MDKQCAKALLQKAVEHRNPEAQVELDSLLAELEQPERHQEPTPRDTGQKQTGLLLRINSSVSSPSLTEYVCRNISKVGLNILQDPVSHSGTLSQIFSQLMTPRGHTIAPTLTEIPSLSSSPTGSDSDSGVMFTIGSDDDDDDVADNCGGICVPHKDGRAPCSTLPRRTSTMPDLQLATS